MKNKTRLIAFLLCCAALLSLSVLADDGGYYSSDESGTAEVPDSIDTIFPLRSLRNSFTALSATP